MARLLSVLSVLLWNIQQRKLRLSPFEQHGVAFPPRWHKLAVCAQFKILSPSYLSHLSHPSHKTKLFRHPLLTTAGASLQPIAPTKQNFSDRLFFLPFSLSPLEYFSFIPTLYKRYRKDTGRVQEDRKNTMVQISTNLPQNRKIYCSLHFTLSPSIIFLLNYYLLIHFYFVPL